MLNKKDKNDAIKMNKTKYEIPLKSENCTCSVVIYFSTLKTTKNAIDGMTFYGSLLIIIRTINQVSI